MTGSTSFDIKGTPDDVLLDLLATVDRRRDAQRIQQIRAELGLRRVYFTERVVSELGQSRIEICRREAVAPSRGQSLSGAVPIDWSQLRGDKVFVVAIFLAFFSLILPSTGFIPAYAVSDIFLMVFYSGFGITALLMALFSRRDFQTPVLKWWAEQLLLLCNVGLLSFSLQLPSMLFTHYLMATPLQQQGQIIDLQRNSQWCHRSVLIEVQGAAQAPLHFCQLSTVDFDLLRPNDRLILQGSHSVIATQLDRIVIMEISQPPSR